MEGHATLGICPRRQVGHQVAGDDMRKEFAHDGCEGNWAVVGGTILLSFLEDRRNIRFLPIVGHFTGVQGTLEKVLEDWGEWDA